LWCLFQTDHEKNTQRIKKHSLARCWWLTPVILATLEHYGLKLSWTNSSQDLSWKNTSQTQGLGNGPRSRPWVHIPTLQKNIVKEKQLSINDWPVLLRDVKIMKHNKTRKVYKRIEKIVLVCCCCNQLQILDICFCFFHPWLFESKDPHMLIICPTIELYPQPKTFSILK
jgi:hypothetical protein